MITEYRMAEMIVHDYALENGWVFDHDPESVDLLVALQNMSDMEDRDVLPSDVRPSYRVVMHSFGKLFGLA
jgi:hypothetical protein